MSKGILLVSIGVVAFSLAGCASGGGKQNAKHANDDYKEIQKDDVENRWCLNKSVVVLQLDRGDSWPNDKKVSLAPTPVNSNCEFRPVFGVGDLFTFRRDGVGMRLTIRDASNKPKDPPLEDLPLDPSSLSQPPVFWSNEAGKVDIFVMLAETRNSKGKLVKYFRVEAFDDIDTKPSCLAERPDSGTSLFRIDKLSGMPRCPDQSANPSYPYQTSVSGGGEGK